MGEAQAAAAMTLLVGLDGSGAAGRALRWAIGLCRPPGRAQLVVATVYVADPADNLGWDDAHDHARAKLELWCQPAREAGLTYRAVVLDGACGPALVEAAEEHGADLTVVSRRGTGSLDALVAGSTADHLAHHARHPLAVVPPGGAPSPPAHILVALDGSADSEAAARWAARLAHRTPARVTAAFVAEPPEVVGRLSAGERAAAEQVLSTRWSIPLRQGGLAPDCVVQESRHPGDALVELAHRTGAELIVAGTRALGRLRPIRLGGVTLQLLRHSDVPVVVVPPEP